MVWDKASNDLDERQEINRRFLNLSQQLPESSRSTVLRRVGHATSTMMTDTDQCVQTLLLRRRFAQAWRWKGFKGNIWQPCPAWNNSSRSVKYLHIVPAGSPSRGGDVTVYVWHALTELAHSLLFFSCAHFCLYGPFNCI